MNHNSKKDVPIFFPAEDIMMVSFPPLHYYVVDKLEKKTEGTWKVEQALSEKEQPLLGCLN